MGVPVPGFNQWLKLSVETNWGSGPGASPIGIRLAGDTAFKGTKTPIRTAIRSADSQNRRLQNISAKYSVSGSLRTPLYPSQATAILGWAGTLAGSPPDLASLCAEHFDGVQGRKYVGGKITQLALASDAESQYATLDIQFLFKDCTDEAVTAPSDYPTESPCLHTELAGAFSVGGAIALFDRFHCTIKNTIVAKFYESATIAMATWAGREVDVQAHCAYTDTALRALFEGQTAATMSAAYSGGPTLTFGAVNFVSDRSTELPLGGIDEQGFTVQAFGASDFAVS